MKHQQTVIKSLQDCGLIYDWDNEHQSGVCRTTSWQAVAQTLSLIYPKAEVFPSSRGVTVQSGSTSTIRLLSPEKYNDGLPVARMVTELTGRTVPIASGPAIRYLLRWLGRAQTPNKERDALIMKGKQYGYNDCTPTKGEKGSLFDITSCYFSLLCRLRSLYVRVGADKVQYHPMPEDMLNRWECVKAIGGSERAFKETLWGVCLGSAKDKPIRIFKNGEVLYKSLPPGPFSTAAKLVARMAWELNRDASSQSKAVYSQTDCVILPYGKKPDIWDRYGVAYKTKASGDYHIVRQHCYQIGNVNTHDYRELLNRPIPDKARIVAPEPTFRYYERVLV